MAKKSKEQFDSKNFVISGEEAEVLRIEYLKGPMREYIRRFMNEYPLVRTVLITVAQYYNDEAYDAVHFRMYPTVLDEFWTPEPDKPWTNKKGQVITPPPPDWYHEDAGYKVLRKNLPFLEFPEGETYSRRYCRNVWDYIRRFDDTFGWDHWLGSAGWDSNGAMIPLFAAFCPGGDEDSDRQPLAVYRRTSEGTLQLEDVSFEFVGKMVRPMMDGIRPKDYDDDEDPEYPFFSSLQKIIAKCAEFRHDPLAEMREHVRRPVSADARWLGLLSWTSMGPSIRESDSERISGMDDALRELKEEWDRRAAWDLKFSTQYGKER